MLIGTAKDEVNFCSRNDSSSVAAHGDDSISQCRKLAQAYRDLGSDPEEGAQHWVPHIQFSGSLITLRLPSCIRLTRSWRSTLWR